MPPAAPIPPEFLAQYDAERAARLRRRAVWCSITILALVGLSWSVTIHDIATGVAFTDGDHAGSAEILTDTLFTAIFAATLVHFARRVRPRAEVVRTFQWVIAVTGLTAVAVTPLVMNASIIPGATLDRTPESDFAQALATLASLFLLHFLASVFVALSPREGLAPLLPVFAAFAAWVGFVSVCSPAQRITLIALAPLTTLPGLAWGWWRYRSFNERFHARAVQKRYAAVTRELSDARRIHEALFPPPVTRGPVRVTYHYEPMRDIGGDFLFIRPLAFPPTAPEGPLLAVLIDVTGHGIAAALAVNRIHAELQTLCVGGIIPEPAAVIRALNALINAVLADSAIFATAIALRVEPGPNATVRWASAGHPPAFLRTPGLPVQRLDSTAPMLGFLAPEDFACDESRADLPPGSTIIAFTDGAIEAADARGQLLGLDRLQSLVATAPRDVPIPETLAQAVAAHRAGPPADDTLIVELALQPIP
jgi:hypothetical protein